MSDAGGVEKEMGIVPAAELAGGVEGRKATDLPAG
jgi:hypothetical protein